MEGMDRVGDRVPPFTGQWARGRFGQKSRGATYKLQKVQVATANHILSEFQSKTEVRSKQTGQRALRSGAIFRNKEHGGNNLDGGRLHEDGKKDAFYFHPQAHLTVGYGSMLSTRLRNGNDRLFNFNLKIKIKNSN